MIFIKRGICGNSTHLLFHYKQKLLYQFMFQNESARSRKIFNNLLELANIFALLYTISKQGYRPKILIFFLLDQYYEYHITIFF